MLTIAPLFIGLVLFLLAMRYSPSEYLAGNTAVSVVVSGIAVMALSLFAPVSSHIVKDVTVVTEHVVTKGSNVYNVDYVVESKNDETILIAERNAHWWWWAWDKQTVLFTAK